MVIRVLDWVLSFCHFRRMMAPGSVGIPCWFDGVVLPFGTAFLVLLISHPKAFT